MKISNLIIVSAALAFFGACKKEDTPVLKNDFIKKSVEPAIVGQNIEFAYAMGSTTSDVLLSASATASIAGGANTGFGLFSYYTTREPVTVEGVNYVAGNDVPLKTVTEASTSGNISTAKMADKIDETYVRPIVKYGTNMVPLKAATVRYYYNVPEEARGKEVSFKFESKTAGSSSSISTPSYKISKMDMARLIRMVQGGACYFSISDMKAYTQAEVEAQNLSSKIDFVYSYKATVNTFAYGHSFVSPSAQPVYLADAVIPANWTKNKTFMEKRIDLFDAQLKGSMPNIYIDDVDFQTLKLDNALDFTLNLAQDQGAFMKTADGKYAAYIYVNKVEANAVTVSIKRYAYN